MKVITYNVNGIRAAWRKGFFDWMKKTDADIYCIQETKAQEEQIPVEEIEKAGYHVFVHSAQKKGYSGVAIFTKKQPDRVHYGIGIQEYDDEGRYLQVDFGDVSVACIYHPSGSSGDARQRFKMKWLDDFQQFIDELKQTREKLILCGDYNICHRAIDIHDPVRNAKNSGFLPEEREWIGGFIDNGFIDSFRHFNDEPHQYTWWSYRANARANNKGWRIDYIMVSRALENTLKRAVILPEAKHSDHCPMLTDFDINL